ncbi:MAG: ABC transporter substrate-binding protein [Desulfobacterales bacterium]|nr:ABC transporter substrate-binding protein [Desulfobacterales bacterium]
MKEMKGVAPVAIAVVIIVAVIAAAAAYLYLKPPEEEEEEIAALRFWHSYGATELAKAEVLIAEWDEDHPDIEVEMEYVPYDMLFQKMVTLLAAGEVPCDLARYDVALTSGLADMGVLMELSDLAEAAGVSEDDFYPGPWETCVWEGGLYGLPLDTTTRILFYRKDLFEAEGVSVPTTWDELRSVASQLTKDLDADGVTDQWGFLYEGYDTWHFNSFLWQAGGSELSSDMKTSTINNDKGVEALQFLLDLIYVDKVNPPPEIWKWPVEALSTGETAMGLSGPWGWACARDIFGLDVEAKLGFATLPAGPAGEASVIGGQNLVMPKFTEHPEEAFELAKYYTSYYYQSEMMKVEQFPTLKAASEAEVIAGNPLWATVAEQMETARSRVIHPKYAEINDITHKYLEEAFAQLKTAQEALDVAAAEINELL